MASGPRALGSESGSTSSAGSRVRACSCMDVVVVLEAPLRHAGNARCNRRAVAGSALGGRLPSPCTARTPPPPWPQQQQQQQLSEAQLLAAYPHSVLVSRRQEGNPMLRALRNVRWQFGDIVPDYLAGQHTAILFLSLRFHLLKPDYIYGRIKALQRAYRSRILLCHVDTEDAVAPLQEVRRRVRAWVDWAAWVRGGGGGHARSMHARAQAATTTEVCLLAGDNLGTRRQPSSAGD